MTRVLSQGQYQDFFGKWTNAFLIYIYIYIYILCTFDLKESNMAAMILLNVGLLIALKVNILDFSRTHLSHD